jgi:hypothetical protein
LDQGTIEVHGFAPCESLGPLTLLDRSAGYSGALVYLERSTRVVIVVRGPSPTSTTYSLNIIRRGS